MGNMHTKYGELAPFSVHNILDNSVTDFELFVIIDGEAVKYAAAGYRWFRAELEALLRSGRDSLYYRVRDEAVKCNYSTGNVIELVDIQKPPSERILKIEEIGARLTQHLFDGNLNESRLEQANDLACALSDCIAEDHTCIKAIRALEDHDQYTLHHSIRVAAYTVAIGFAMGFTDQGLMAQIALGGIFHDIGKRDVPMSILNKKGPLTDEEWVLMKSHPYKGWLELSQAQLSHTSREIILHHHERFNGKGYPDGLRGSEVLPEVQVAALADIFDALTSSRSYQKRRSRFEALSFIKERLLHEEVSPDAYKALVGILAS